MPGINRDWQDLEHYLSIHDQCLEQCSEYFVESPELVTPRVKNASLIRINGDLFCKGGLVIHVDKTLEVDDRRRVRGKLYSYQAQFVDFPPPRVIFRYDNSHPYQREGHLDSYHKHVFSIRTWRELEVIYIGRQKWPTLKMVIDELFDWWQEHKDDKLIYPGPT